LWKASSAAKIDVSSSHSMIFVENALTYSVFAGRKSPSGVWAWATAPLSPHAMIAAHEETV
jgi:hypothetical protein